MSNTKHTLGPWRVVPGSIKDIASIHGNKLSGVDTEIAVLYGAFIMDSEEEEFSANATLIAAAPELLEALKKIANHPSEADASISMREIAENAIAKAENQNA